MTTIEGLIICLILFAFIIFVVGVFYWRKKTQNSLLKQGLASTNAIERNLCFYRVSLMFCLAIMCFGYG